LLIGPAGLVATWDRKPNHDVLPLEFRATDSQIPATVELNPRWRFFASREESAIPVSDPFSKWVGSYLKYLELKQGMQNQFEKLGWFRFSLLAFASSDPEILERNEHPIYGCTSMVLVGDNAPAKAAASERFKPFPQRMLQHVEKCSKGCSGEYFIFAIFF